jgi:hypothetical protein
MKSHEATPFPFRVFRGSLYCENGNFRSLISPRKKLAQEKSSTTEAENDL